MALTSLTSLNSLTSPFAKVELTNLKYQDVTVNSAKENCGNPQKSYVESTKVLFLQKKNAEIRKNLSCYDCK
mgnify:CR=1 FL=1